jgi:catechol 2,3-dioxygenase-like lactoylglutathione lyase family enzyme
VTVRATSLNHVSVCASDLEESIRFYCDTLGLEPVPTPNFGFPAQWLRVGDLQLHLFQRAEDAPRYHHFALTVDDFTAVYARARELGIFDRETFGHHVYELPGGCAQMYIRDPAGNCVEIDCADVSTLDRSVVTDLKPLPNPQSEENRHATLFLGLRA